MSCMVLLPIKKQNFVWFSNSLSLKVSKLFYVFTACKKEKNAKPETLREKNLALILNKNWVPVFFGYDYNGDGIPDRDIMAMENSLAECQTDDYYIFKTDTTFGVLSNQITNGCGIDGGPWSWGLGANGTDFDYAGLKGQLITINDSTFKYYVLNVQGEKMYMEFER